MEPDRLNHQSAAGHQVTLTARANTWFCRERLDLPSGLSWHGLPPVLQRRPLNCHPCDSPGAHHLYLAPRRPWPNDASHCPKPGLAAPPVKPVDPTEETGDAQDCRGSPYPPLPEKKQRAPGDNLSAAVFTEISTGSPTEKRPHHPYPGKNKNNLNRLADKTTPTCQPNDDGRIFKDQYKNI